VVTVESYPSFRKKKSGKKRATKKTGKKLSFCGTHKAARKNERGGCQPLPMKTGGNSKEEREKKEKDTGGGGEGRTPTTVGTNCGQGGGGLGVSEGGV